MTEIRNNDVMEVETQDVCEYNECYTKPSRKGVIAGALGAGALIGGGFLFKKVIKPKLDARKALKEAGMTEEDSEMPETIPDEVESEEVDE